MPYVKLDTGILESSLWLDRAAREVFITALLMAVPREIMEPMPQFYSDSNELTGFVVPQGWYGFVESAGSGIIRRAFIDLDEGEEALRTLGGTDRESRTPEYDGRRLVRVDGGFIILNYFKYRDKDHTAAERQARLRARRREAKDASRVTTVTNRDVTLRHATNRDASRIADADADAKALKSKSFTADAVRSTRGTRIPSDFHVTEKHREWAKVNQMPSPDSLIEEFKDFWTAKAGPNGTKIDWDATFRTWMRNAKQRGSVNGGAKKRTGLDWVSSELRALDSKLAD